MNTNKRFFIFFTVLFVICSAVSAFIFTRKTDTAVIYIDGKEYSRVNLSSCAEPYKIYLPHNTVLVEDGHISVVEADCPDKLCVKQGKKIGGAPIVCLPNKVTIVFEKSKGADALSW